MQVLKDMARTHHLKFLLAEASREEGTAQADGTGSSSDDASLTVSHGLSSSRLTNGTGGGGTLMVTDRLLDEAGAPRAKLMLVYLNSDTWQTGSCSEQFADDVRAAMNYALTLVLAHEMPGIEEAKRHACKFDDFFACERGTTPADLVSKGIYANAAVALKGSAWRETSLTLLLNTIAADGKTATAVTSVSERLSQRSDEPTPPLSRAATMLRSLTMSSISVSSKLNIFNHSPPRYPSLGSEVRSSSSSCESGVAVHQFEPSEDIEASEGQRVADLVASHVAHLNWAEAPTTQTAATTTAVV